MSLVEFILFSIAVCFAAFFAAAFSYLLKWAITPNQIFGFYAKWLETIPEAIAKPLGKCILCFNVHSGILIIYPVFYIWVLNIYPVGINIIAIFLIPLISNFFLRKMTLGDYD